MEAEWDLSCSFTSDGQGIRCATCLGDSTILTGTQGGSLIAYDLLSGDLQVLDYQHNHSVTSLLSNDKVYITGCKDSIIRIFDHQHNLVSELKAHEKPVTSLAWAKKPNYLISGSWDGTARIWNLINNSVVAVLPDHENSVCVAGLGESGSVLNIATGSAGIASNNAISGHTVRLWNVNTTSGEVTLLHSVANDHDGPIRDILYDSPGTLLTCSNDGTVKIRDATNGSCLSTMMFFTQQHHPPMLLSMASAQGDTLAAAAEDGNVVIWIKDTAGGQPQIIRHAACVWNVVGLTNGDIATCCDDGILRVFTKAADRMAPAEERERFTNEVQAAIQKTQGGPSPDEIAKLPRWEDSMTMPGKSEGQVQVFQKNGIAIAAQWNAASRAWIEVGEVTGQSDTGLIDGVQYDHVFPIEIDQTGGGVATLQIGYNTGENPFVAAQRFIDAHMLPQYHLSQIAEYLQQRAGQQPTTLGEAPAAAASPPAVSYQYLPIRTYKSFDLVEKTASTTLDKMKTKLQEFAELADDSPELAQVSSLVTTLGASNRYHASKIQDSELKVLAGLLNNATPSKSFPALDLARLTVLHPDAADRPSSFWVGIFQRAISLCTTTESLEGPAVTAIPMLSLRLFANAIKAGGAQQAVATYLDLILDCAMYHAKSSNKNVRLSVATLLYNVCFYCHQKNDAAGQSSVVKIVEIISAVLDMKTYESEAMFRVLLALGTICLASTEAKATANVLLLTPKVQMASSPHTDQAKAAAKEITSVLSG